MSWQSFELRNAKFTDLEEMKIYERSKKKIRLKKNPAGHKKVNINNKNDLWITHTLSYRNNGKTVPPHSDTTEYQTVCVASFRPPNYGTFLRTYSQLSQVRFLHTWGKRNSTCDTDVRQAGACFERSGSCSSERVKQKKTIHEVRQRVRPSFLL